MHCGRDATYAAILCDLYWRNLSKHVRTWVKHCPECIKFKTSSQKPGPMNIRLYQYLFHTLDFDLLGKLPTSINGNKYILTSVCPFSNFFISVPVSDTKLLQLVLVFCQITFFLNLDFLRFYRLIVEANSSVQSPII